MAYNNNPYFGNPYFNYPMQQQIPVQQQSPASTDDRIWVQSAQAAEAYLVAPNSFVRLWDSQKPVFYEKRADSCGKPFPMEVYEYNRKASESSNSAVLTSSNTIDYTDKIKALEGRIEALENMRRQGGKQNARQQSNADDSAV